MEFMFILQGVGGMARGLPPREATLQVFIAGGDLEGFGSSPAQG